MSGSKKRRFSPQGADKTSGGGASRRASTPVVRGALCGAGTAAAAAIVLALIFAAFGLRGADPARLAPIFGLAALAISSGAAGAVFERTARVPPLLCAAVGAGIAAAALLLSLIPSLPEAPLPVPKALCAAIPVVCAALGGRLAAPRGGRRRTRRKSRG